ncbi:MAG: hypothetical protein HQL35_14450 [Alphaproteobacteria bacterium]|nr:hypothetical protein [Alphaproteobacteria bacterium]
MITKRKLAVLAAGAACAFASPALADVLAENGAWQAVSVKENGDTVCVMSAAPDKAEGDYAKRGDAFVIISHRPAEKRFGEISVQAGYDYQSGSQVIVTIDGAKTFKLFTKDGYAWAYDADGDRDLIRAMRGGSSMVVKGTSSRGTQTTDTYSLSGFTATSKAIDQACGVK